MKKTKNKAMISLITMFLMLTIAASLIASLPQVNAQTPTFTRSFIYVGVSPNVVGVGQDVIIVTWTADMPPDVGETDRRIDSPNGRAAWNNPAIVTITKPDGTNETVTMPRTDPVGATWTKWVPQEVGTYSLQAYFPGEWKNNTFTTPPTYRYYKPDFSEVANLTVQQDPTPTWKETPLPNDYWTRPLNGVNRGWYSLAGDWLGGAQQNYPVGTAGFTSNYASGLGTETPHILWTRPYYVGGLMEDIYGSTGYQTQHYQGMSFSGIVLNGKVHYTPRTTAHANQGWESFDLYTGERLFLDVNATRPSFGQVYNYESPNQHGGFAYLWRTSNVILPEIVQIPNAIQFANLSVVRQTAVQTVNRTATPVTTGTLWEMLDGYTGQTITYIANVTSGGTSVYGKDGSILRYIVANLSTTSNPINYYLQVWNSSYGTMPSSQLGTGYWQWRPAGGTFGGSNAYLGGLAYNYVHDGRDFYSLNVSIPSVLGPLNTRSNQTGSILQIVQDKYVVIGTSGVNDEQGIAPGYLMAISLEPGKEGTKLWSGTFTPPSGADAETVSFTGCYAEDGMFLFSKQKTQERFGYSLDTFQQVWKSEPETQFGYYGTSTNYYNGTLLSYGYGGIIYCRDVKTGQVLWTYEATSIGTESAYGGMYPIGVVIIADGKLYTVTGEHSPTQPLMRGPNLRSIDAATGKEIWKITGFFGGMSPTSSNILMADGILVGLNHFDNQLYAFGRGPSATTVSAENDVSVYGSKVVIKGTVTDQSLYGRRNTNGVLDFSLKGTPAISDADMQAWMEYKFMQQAIPANAKGVPVTLDAIDPNGNYVPIGNTTSDMNGNFGLAFTPEVPGDYQIIATFAGSKAYGASFATTYLTVEEAPSATPEPTPLPVSVADMYFVPAIAGVIIAIAIVGAILALLLLKKRP